MFAAECTTRVDGSLDHESADAYGAQLMHNDRTPDPALIGELRTMLEHTYQGDVGALVRDVESEIRKPKKIQTPASGKVVIQARNLSKTYRVGEHTLHALSDVSFEIHEGEIVAIMGPSGSGKTTLLNMLGGLDKPTSGSVSVAGNSLQEMNDRALSTYRNQRIGFVFQFFYLQPFLSVRQNVAVPLLFSKERTTADIDAALGDVGLAERADHLPGQLSGGQAQRAAIARALVNRPRVLFADEPTGNLDQHTASEILGLLTELNRTHGTTIVLVTHDKHVAQLAGRVLTIKDGKLQ